ncbi:MAG: response regulator [Polyangiaceae bacterium]|nr:response regulator [Polyangiaceae bacterium]
MDILIIDDSKAMRMIVRKTLRQAGLGEHDIREAGDGLEGLKAIEEKLPHLVLCDWNMPNMTGIQLLETLRERDVKVTFGFVTSEGTVEMRQQAASAGAKFLIAKPFTPEAFQEALQPILGG